MYNLTSETVKAISGLLKTHHACDWESRVGLGQKPGGTVSGKTEEFGEFQPECACHDQRNSGRGALWQSRSTKKLMGVDPTR
jgi:hypothetical protein